MTIVHLVFPFMNKHGNVNIFFVFFFAVRDQGVFPFFKTSISGSFSTCCICVRSPRVVCVLLIVNEIHTMLCVVVVAFYNIVTNSNGHKNGSGPKHKAPTGSKFPGDLSTC